MVWHGLHSYRLLSLFHDDADHEEDDVVADDGVDDDNDTDVHAFLYQSSSCWHCYHQYRGLNNYQYHFGGSLLLL